MYSQRQVVGGFAAVDGTRRLPCSLSMYSYPLQALLRNRGCTRTLFLLASFSGHSPGVRLLDRLPYSRGPRAIERGYVPFTMLQGGDKHPLPHV